MIIFKNTTHKMVASSPCSPYPPRGHGDGLGRRGLGGMWRTLGVGDNPLGAAPSVCLVLQRGGEASDRLWDVTSVVLAQVCRRWHSCKGRGVPFLLKDLSSFPLGTRSLGLLQLPWLGTVPAHSRLLLLIGLINCSLTSLISSPWGGKPLTQTGPSGLSR